MPISIDEYRVPKFIRFKNRYPLIENGKSRFTDTIVNPRVYEGRSARALEVGWKLPGYNPNHNSTSVERINLKNDSISLKPY